MIIVTPNPITLDVGQTLQLLVNTSGVMWSSANNAVATVSQAGLARGVSSGSTTIRAHRKNQRTDVPIIIRNRNDTTPVTQRLMQKANLEYLGGFRFPNIEGYGFYTRGLAYNPANNSLITGGSYSSPPGAAHIEKVSEITIPSTITPTYASMVLASVIQNPTDITEGKDYFLGSGGTDLEPSLVTIHRGGLHVYNGKVIGTAFVEYDAAFPYAQQLSHWTSGLNFATTGDFKGAYRLGSLSASMLAGYMCDIPSDWQVRLGGPCLTGQGTLAVIGRTSFGPSLHVFDPDALVGAVGSTYASTPLVYYPTEHQTLGRWDNIFPDDPNAYANHYFNGASMMGGAVFPSGTDTVLVFGNVGYGICGYGVSTTEISLNMQPVPGEPGVYYLYDLYNVAGHGTHSWPYVNHVWAYDANDLYAAKLGSKQPWEVVPYAIWDMSDVMPVHDGAGIDQSFGAALSGAAYDPATQRVFVVQAEGAEHWVPGFGAFSYNPLIRVFHVVMS